MKGQSTSICVQCGELIRPDGACEQKTICKNCEAQQHYQRFGEEVLRLIRENKEACIQLTFAQLKRTPHQHMMNRLGKCRNPNAELMVIHFYGFSLVLTYDVPSVPVHNYLISNSFCGTSMTEFKKSRLLGYALEEQRGYFQIKGATGEALHLWKQPYKIEAKTDRVSDYRKEWRGGVLDYEGNQWGDTESFYIIGSLHRQTCL